MSDMSDEKTPQDLLQALLKGKPMVVAGSGKEELLATLKKLAGGAGVESEPGPEPLSPDEALAVYLTAEWTPQRGDLVVIRPEFDQRYKFPTAGMRCVVTQVLNPPYRSGAAGTSEPGTRHDITLGFKVSVDGLNVYSEHMYDSRNFTKVGTVSDMLEEEQS